MDRGNEVPKAVEPGFTPVDHLVEDGPTELLMVRRQAMLHLDLDRRRADVPDSLEERVEICDVEVDDLAERSGLVIEVDFETQSG